MKKIFFTLILVNITLFGAQQTPVDRAVKEVNLAVKKVKKIASDIATKTSEIGHKKTSHKKLFTKKGNSLFVEKTLIDELNNVIAQENVKIKYIKKNTTTNVLTMYVYRKGESKNLLVTLKSFNWGYSKDGKNIVLENIDILLNIKWMDSLIKDALVKNNGYIVLPNNTNTSSFLETIQPAIETTYKDNKTSQKEESKS